MLVTYRLVRTQMQNQALAERQKCQRDGKRAPPLALAGPSPPSRGSGPSRKPKALTPKRAKHFPCVTPLKTRSFPCEGFELLVQHDRRLDRFGGHCWNRLCCSHRLGAGIPLRILPTDLRVFQRRRQSRWSWRRPWRKGKEEELWLQIGTHKGGTEASQNYITEEMTATRFFRGSLRDAGSVTLELARGCAQNSILEACSWSDADYGEPGI